VKWFTSNISQERRAKKLDLSARKTTKNTVRS